MKNPNLSVLFVFCHLFVFSQIPTNGLIGAWTFSGNANDISGTNNHGAVFNASLTTDRCGNANSAYLFNGQNTYIRMLTGGPLGNNARSVSFWVATTNSSMAPVVAFDYGFIATSGPSGPTCWQIQSNYGCIGFGVDVSTDAFIKGPRCLNNGAWHHVVAVYDPSVSTQYGSTLIYIDGQSQNLLCDVGGTVVVPNTLNAEPVTIGRSAHANNRYFTGKLDDFYFYNRALTPAEVQQLYLTCSPPILGPAILCSAASATYSTPTVAGASYTWIVPASWTGNSSSHSITVVPSGNSGTLQVISSTSCGITSSSTLAISASGQPMNISASTPTLCQGTNVTLTANGGSTYTWMPGNLTGPNVTVSPQISTIYTVSAITGTGSSSCSASGTINLQVVICNGVVDENSNFRKIRMYPNPVSGILTIENFQSYLKIELFSIAGNKITEVIPSGDKVFLDMSDSAKGAYILRLSGFTKTLYLKLFKE